MTSQRRRRFRSCLVGAAVLAYLSAGATGGAWRAAGVGASPCATASFPPGATPTLSEPTRGPEEDPGALEARLSSLLNGERARRGLVPLTRLDALDVPARLNTEQMARAREVRHGMPGNLSRVTIAWRTIGENVGAADSVEEVHRLMMASRRHRQNILQPAFDAIGLAVARGDDGRVYVTEVFIGRSPGRPK